MIQKRMEVQLINLRIPQVKQYIWVVEWLLARTTSHQAPAQLFVCCSKFALRNVYCIRTRRNDTQPPKVLIFDTQRRGIDCSSQLHRKMPRSFVFKNTKAMIALEGWGVIVTLCTNALKTIDILFKFNIDHYIIPPERALWADTTRWKT